MIRKFSFSLMISFLISFLVIVNTGQAGANENLNNINYAEEVIYQIVTDRFFDGDPTNNPEGALFSPGCLDLTKYCGGDWQGIIEKIEDGYLLDMGITAIWISPPIENVMEPHPGGFASYHGYWGRDFKRTNSAFGSLADFSRLIETAHNHDIKVIIDFVPNHTSPVDIEDGALYDNGRLVGHYSNDSGDYFYTNGGSDFSSYEDSIYRNLYDLASLNQQNSFIDRYLKESIQMWLDLGIDGIRVDAVAHMPVGWQKNFVSSIYDYNPVFTFGEWFTGASGSDEYHYFINNSGMSALDFRYAQVVQDVLRNNDGTMYDLETVLRETESVYEKPQDQVTFIDNHDINRFSRSGHSTRPTDLGLALLLTSRGVPTIYYGTEIYMTGDGDPDNRQMMNTFDQSTVAYQIIQRLSSLRQENKAIAYGDTTERWINEDVFIYERSFNGEYALVALNRNLNHSYQISSLVTDMPPQLYEDELSGLLDGQSITVDQNGSVQPFWLAPGEVSVWQYSNGQNIAPEIGQIGPPIGKPGDEVRIDGSGFGNSTGDVSFAGSTMNVLSWSDDTIIAELPVHNGGKNSITVRTNSGESSNGYPFELLTGSQTSVRFVVNQAETSVGENLYVVGHVPELGSWDPDKAIGPMFNQILYSYPTWYYDVSVPANQDIEYKYIMKDQNGNVSWESGGNHIYRTPENSTGIVEVNFNQ
ncbi:alpha-amylase family glycosyl hydrolase [Alkalihalobacillus sp. 1P02AB]|uniref:alpha-amylase family glycosyl hydrolase n=1 Tax=Alkalihalobacillus sp. 1P02AB TaxID=3132260 RepID=UPI0039A6D765